MLFRSDDGDYTPRSLARDIAPVIEHLAPHAEVVCGMSLGGLTTLALAYQRPDLVNHLVMVDITPGVTPEKSKAITDFVNGPQSFASFEDLLARTIEHNPTRSQSSLRRGILHNARQLDDFSWVWRYDRRSHPRREPGTSVAAGMWEMIERVHCPVTLVRGGASPVVDDADVAAAAEWLAIAGYFNAGQDCTAATRMLVSSRIYDDFVSAMADAAKAT